MSFPDLHHLLKIRKDLWQQPESRASVMIGTGFSRNADPKPGVKVQFPLWRDLARSMFDELNPPQPEEPEREREARFNNSNPLRIASEYEAEFKRVRLNQFLQEKIPDNEYLPGEIHKLLLELPWVDIFTTNYDTLLERTVSQTIYHPNQQGNVFTMRQNALLERTKVSDRSYHLVTQTSELPVAFRPRIIKLHGSFFPQTPLIVTEEDYRRYPDDFDPFVNTVKQSLLENTFVLIGFSGDDPNFTQWIGWIRDKMKDLNASIYLIGQSFRKSERSLFQKQGVIPIDLAPLKGGDSPNGEYAASIDWFLRALSDPRPPRFEKWPILEKRLVSSVEGIPLFPFVFDEKVPEPVNSFSPSALPAMSDDDFMKIIARWQYERLHYPGWLVAAEDVRSRLWSETKDWVIPIINFTKESSASNRIFAFREITWRLEVAMVPLFINWTDPFRKAVDEYFKEWTDGRDSMPDKMFSTENVFEAWLEIAFVLLRDAREEYNADLWTELKAMIDKVAEKHPYHSDRLHYEEVLWEIWNVRRGSAKELLVRWQPADQSPLAKMRKAGLLAELDEIEEARDLLRDALSKIRQPQQSQEQNSKLFSLEGWCTYLLFFVESSSNTTDSRKLRNEFEERWKKLNAFGGNPRSFIEYFEKTLAADSPKPQKVEQKTRGFDPGGISRTHHYISDYFSAYFPAFAAIRLYEQVGLPLRLPSWNITGDMLRNACRWLEPLMSFWSPALLVRAGKFDDLFKKADFLTRTKVAQMDMPRADRLYAWCMQILEKEMCGSVTEKIKMGSAQESLLRVLPELLSRIVFKLDKEKLDKSFFLAIEFHQQPRIRSHIQLAESCGPWFERLYLVADEDLLLKWLPTLITFSLSSDNIHPFLISNRSWPDPLMQDFPVVRCRKALKESTETIRIKIAESIDWLITKAQNTTDDLRMQAIIRLDILENIDALTPDQRKHFGELLWKRTDKTDLPDCHNIFYMYSFLHLPSLDGVDVASVIKKNLLITQSENAVSRNDKGQMTVSSKQDQFFTEIILASRPVLKLFNDFPGAIEWTPKESKQLYLRMREWWNNDKQVFERVNGRNTDDYFSITGPVRQRAKKIAPFLFRAVLSYMTWASETEWNDYFGWLTELRKYGLFLTPSLPYMLVLRPDKKEEISEQISDDLDADHEEAVVSAARAIRHWKHLSSAKKVPAPNPRLFQVLLERVIFRRNSGIKECIEEVKFLIAELPEAITSEQAALLTSSLIPWHLATELNAGQEDEGDVFPEEERPELRAAIGELAFALKRWYEKNSLGDPLPMAITKWEKLCANDPLPEVRRAFDPWWNGIELREGR